MRCDKKEENAFKRASFISPSTSPFRRLQLFHSLWKRRRERKKKLNKKNQKNPVRNLLNKSYPFPPPTSLLSFVQIKGWELPGADNGAPSPHLGARELWGDSEANQALTAQPEGRGGSAAAPAGARCLLPVGLVVWKQGTEHVGKADNLRSVCD